MVYTSLDGIGFAGVILVILGVILLACTKKDIEVHRVIACRSSNLYLSVEDAIKFHDGIVYRVKGDKIRVVQPATGCSINTIEVEKAK